MTACGAWFDIQGYIIFVNLFEDPSSDERRRHLRSQGSKRQREVVESQRKESLCLIAPVWRTNNPANSKFSARARGAWRSGA